MPAKSTKFAKPDCHRLLTTRLRNDPAFAFDFAREFRDIPPIDPDAIMPMLLASFEKHLDPALDRVSVADVLLAANVDPGATLLPGREPWPDRWMLLIDVVDETSPTMLLDWPLRYASLRAQFGCPLTAMVVVETLELAVRINEIFAIEPELTPVVVVSDALHRPPTREPLLN
ncbi:hypothetical protein ACNOYE_36425 [Nannocystaceae bacterium ST9]